mmetsp:Transcript_8002/g.12439  ORF Transcript_8002/g.12439 Transcript_8002/m.12439 type:complete len:308 (-) Transcript_8002:399-1322(-)
MFVVFRQISDNHRIIIIEIVIDRKPIVNEVTSLALATIGVKDLFSPSNRAVCDHGEAIEFVVELPVRLLVGHMVEHIGVRNQSVSFISMDIESKVACNDYQSSPHELKLVIFPKLGALTTDALILRAQIDLTVRSHLKRVGTLKKFLVEFLKEDRHIGVFIGEDIDVGLPKGLEIVLFLAQVHCKPGVRRTDFVSASANGFSNGGFLGHLSGHNVLLRYVENHVVSGDMAQRVDPPVVLSIVLHVQLWELTSSVLHPLDEARKTVTVGIVGCTFLLRYFQLIQKFLNLLDLFLKRGVIGGESNSLII